MNFVATSTATPASSAAVGADAIQLAEISQRNRVHIEESLFLGWRRQLADQVYAVARECSQADWDGYGALPMKIESIAAARQFVDLLPDGIAIPEVTPEPTGFFSFDWDKGKGRMISITVEPYHVIYAGILGAEDFRGKSYLGAGLPSSILQPLKTYFRA